MNESAVRTLTASCITIAVTILLAIVPFKPAMAQPGYISTIAGGGNSIGTALRAELNDPRDVVMDSLGNFYISDTGNNIIRKVTPGGAISTVAGTGVSGFCGDGGSAVNACLNGPRGVTIDSSGNLYIADSDNYRVRKVTPGGIISTVAGNGVQGFDGDGGNATDANFDYPYDVSVDQSGNLYIVDTYNNRIRKVTFSGQSAIISTVAGNGSADYSGDDGPATDASLNAPRGFFVDGTGIIYIADTGNNRIRRVAANGDITTLAGDGNAAFAGDNGPAIAASLNGPIGITVDVSGNLFISDTFNCRVRKVDSVTKIISTIAGNGNTGFNGDNIIATAATVDSPRGIVVNSLGTVYFIEDYNHRLRSITTDGIIHTVAGSGAAGYGGDGGAATDANLNLPRSIAYDSSGNLFIADLSNHRIRKISTGNIISTVAGSGTAGFSGDGLAATAARLDSPYGIAVDNTGNIYIADTNNNRIRKVAINGVISTIAGTGVAAYSGDGSNATAAGLNAPHGVAIDGNGIVYIADTGNHRIRTVTLDGRIYTIAGDGVAGYGGENGPATGARLNSPRALTVDSSGTLFIADTENNRIRKVTAAGVISTVAGNGDYNNSGFTYDGGPATAAYLAKPAGVTVDTTGNLYIADTDFNQIRKVLPDGRLKTIAGNGSGYFSGDEGPAIVASLFSPTGLALDNNGNLLLADSNNSRIRNIENVNSPLPTGAIDIFESPATVSRIVYLSLHCSDRFGNKCTSMRISTDGTVTAENWVSYVDYTTVSLPPVAGMKTVYVQFKDSDGLESPVYSASTFFDQPPPIGSISINGGATLSWSPTVTLTLSCMDLLSVTCQGMRISTDGTLDDESWIPFAASHQVTLPAGNGNRQVTVQFLSVDGFTSSIYTADIDVHLVTITITSHPPASSPRDVTFEFSASEPASYECRIDFDESIFRPCSSPYTTTLPGGRHTFEVKATDLAGAYSDTARYDWVIMDILAGSAYTWGWNYYGQLGNGTFDILAHPLAEKIPTPLGFTQVSASNISAAGLRNDGTVWIWGGGSSYQIPAPWQIPTSPDGFENIIAIAAHQDTLTALKSDSTVWLGHGYDNGNGQGLTYITTALTNFSLQVAGHSGPVAISAGNMALKSDGTVWTWQEYALPVQVNGLANMVAIAYCGTGTRLALDNAGAVWSWSTTNEVLGRIPTVEEPATTPGRVSTASGLGPVSAIACGNNFAMAVSNGVVWTWGKNNFGQLGIGSIPDPDGSILPVFTSIQTNGKIAAGAFHGLAVSKSNTIYTWGRNTSGELGNGLHDNLPHPIPNELSYMSGVSAISAGYGFSLALRDSWATSDFTPATRCNEYWPSGLLLRVDPQNKVHTIWSDTCGSGSHYSTNDSGIWSSEILDDIPTNLVFSSDGTPHYVLKKYNGSTNDLIHYYKPAGGSWTAETIETESTAQGIIFTIDSSDSLHICYTTSAGIKYLKKTGAAWSSPLLIVSYSSQYWTPYFSRDSMTVGTDGTVHIVYTIPTDFYGSGNIFYVNGSGASWTAPVVRAPLRAGSLAIRTSGTNDSVINIAYTYSTTGSYPHTNLRFITNRSQSASSSNETDAIWTDSSVEEYVFDYGNSLSLAVKNGKINLAFFDNDLKFATTPDRNGPTSFLITTVDSDYMVGYLSSMDTDSFGISHILYTYQDGSGQNKLKYATNGDVIGPIGTMTITGPGNPTYTTSRYVTLHPHCDDGNGSGCWQMKFSNDNKNWSSFEAFTATKSWSLAGGEGKNTTYVKYRDAANNWSSVFSADIFLDSVKPTGTLGIVSSNGFTKSRLVLLNTSCSDAGGDTSSGCDTMKFSTDGTNYQSALPYATESPLFIPDNDGLKHVYATYSDKAGNASVPYHATVTLDLSAPITTPSALTGLFASPFSVSLSCEDGSGSGCASTWYSLDGGPETLYTGSSIAISGLKKTPYVLNYYSVDALGNKEITRTATYTFIIGVTTLSLDAPPTVLQNGLLDVSGKLTRLPNSEADPNNGMDLSGLPVTLTVAGPKDSQCEAPCTITTTVDTQGQSHPILTYSSLGHYEIKGINTFNVAGIYTLTAHFAGTGLHKSVDSTPESLLVGTSAGYAIIVEGKVQSEDGLASHNKTTNRIYDTLKTRGFVDGNIMYFNYGGTMIPGVDGVPRKGISANDTNSIRWAIETWAKDRMNGAPAPLYVIFVDHGNDKTFYIDPDEIHTDELNSWLTNMEAGLNTTASLQKRIIILGACYSGSFVQAQGSQLPSVSGPGRIVITSAATDEQSYKGPNEPDGIRSGEFFMEELFKSLRKGSNLKAAFVDATTQTRSFTSQGGGSPNSINGYNDTAVQHPLLEDNGDGIGSNTLGDGIGDGLEAANIHLGVGVTNASLGPADIKSVSATQFLTAAETTRTLELRPYSNSALSSAWFEVKAPGITLEAVPNQTGQLNLELPRQFMTLVGGINGSWQSDYSGFTTAGRYEVFYFTNSTNEEISEMRRSVVYKLKPALTNPAPNAFDLVAPVEVQSPGNPLPPPEALVGTTFNLVWEPSYDANGLTYTLQVASDAAFQNIVFQKEELQNSWYYIDKSTGLSDDAHYFWRVIAVDSFGEQTVSTHQWRFYTNDTNFPSLCMITGTAGGVTPSTPTEFTVVAKQNGVTVAQTTTFSGGSYFFNLTPGTYVFKASGTGFTGTDKTVNASTCPSAQIPLVVSDAAKPVVTLFTIPATSYNTIVPITTLTVTDNSAGTLTYCVTENSSSTGCSWGSKPTQYDFGSTGPKTLYAFARDAALNVSTGLAASTTIYPPPTLQVNLTGDGWVYQTPTVVNSIDCDSTKPVTSVCSTTGTAFSLVASESDWRYRFAWWSGPFCNTSNATTCSFSMSGNTTMTAVFNEKQFAKTTTEICTSLQYAVDHALDKTTVLTLADYFQDNLLFNRSDNAEVTIDGGWTDGNFDSRMAGGFTTVKKLTIQQGTLKIKGPVAVR
jgi:alpha-tubulin suppressor-like RCC1 family protein/sugar lactone lactonase YvrE